MEPWQSWAVALGLAGAGWWYYSQDDKSRHKGKGLQSTLSTEQANGRQRHDKQTSRRVEDSAGVPPELSTNQNASKPNRKRKVPKPVEQQPSPSIEVQEETEEDYQDAEEDYNDKEWAAQLQARQKGVDLNRSEASGGAKSQNKDYGMSNGFLAPTGDGFETVRSKKSNQAGAGAASPAGSSERSLASGDVSDMLEAPIAGPSVLRITGEEPAKKQYAPRPEKVTETKKQRQRRRKNEEAKLQREEDEKERQMLLEQQRRTARVARGEPAKNGLAPAPTSNAWSRPAQPSSSSPPLATHDGTLLDTFEHDAGSTTSSNELQTNNTTPATAASTYEQDLPSEEAQMEMLSRMTSDEGWNEVTKGKKNKKKGQGIATPSESSSREGNYLANSSNQFLQNAQSNTTYPGTSTKGAGNGFAALAEKETTPLVEMRGHPMDSDWDPL